MLFKLSALAVLVAPLVSALTVSQPSQAVNNGGSMTFTWTTSSGDPSTFSVFLENPAFNNVFGVANNVDASLGTLTIQVPAVPPNQQYTIIVVPINNVNQVLAQSPPFNIGANPSTSLSTPAVTSTATGLTTPTPTRPVTTPGGTIGGSTFGTLVSNTNTATGVGASTTGASSPTTSNSAALPVRANMNMGVAAAMVLSVFAGAAVVAL